MHYRAIAIGAPAGYVPVIQIWNPPGSGKIMELYAFRLYVGTATAVNVATTAVPLQNDHGENLEQDWIYGAQNNSYQIGVTTTRSGVYVPSNLPSNHPIHITHTDCSEFVKFPEPFRFGPGRGVIFWPDTTVGTSLGVSAHIKEVDLPPE